MVSFEERSKRIENFIKTYIEKDNVPYTVNKQGEIFVPESKWSKFSDIVAKNRLGVDIAYSLIPTFKLDNKNHIEKKAYESLEKLIDESYKKYGS